MVNAIIGNKVDQSQGFLEDGQRIPITRVHVPKLPVVAMKTKQKHGYAAMQLGLGTKKHPTKALLGHARGAKLDYAPRFLREVSYDVVDQVAKVGDTIAPADVLKPGDIVDVTGVSKGKGYAGVVKRHHFKGGPRTHGQSDRERAPGSIGQTTTPGRVYKGKRMAGRMGHKRVTIQNLTVVDVLDDAVLIKGLVPGPRNTPVVIQKRGVNRKFIPLYKEGKESQEAPKVEKVEPIRPTLPDQGKKVEAVVKVEEKENAK